jgi:uncharacterized glyoxalase superfamily protein PhnB
VPAARGGLIADAALGRVELVRRMISEGPNVSPSLVFGRYARTSLDWSPGRAYGPPATVLTMLTNRSAPPSTVTPVLIYPDVRAAVAWLEAALGFEERVRIGDSHRAQLRVGSDGAIVVADVRGDQVAPSEGVVTQLVKVRVPDVDEAFARAREAGARVVEDLRTYEYGERSGVLEDPGGHRWELTQSVRDTAPEEWGGTTIAPW